MAREQLEDLALTPSSNGEPRVKGLVLKPDVAYAVPGEPRSFSIYIDKDSFLQATEVVEVRSHRDCGPGTSSRLNLNHFSHTQHMRISWLHILRSAEMLRTSLLGFGQEWDLWKISQNSAHKRNRAHEEDACLILDAGCSLRSLLMPMSISPIQRVSYTGGKVTVFVNFPPVNQYLGPDGTGMDDTVRKPYVG